MLLLMKERDLATDLAMCEAVASGPWKVVPVSVEFSDEGKVIASFEITLPVESVSFPEAEAIAQFIAAARDGWPEAIRRAIDAEAEQDTLDNIYAKTERLWQWARENLSGETAEQFWQIAANGSLMHENPVYHQRINCLKHEVTCLREQVAQLQKQKQNIYEEYARVKANHDRYRELVAAINGKPDGDYWAWMPGEDNNLESLSYPVLIPAEWLRNLLDEAREEGKAELARVKALNIELAAQNAVMRKALEFYATTNPIRDGVYEHGRLAKEALSTNADQAYRDRLKALEKVAELAEK